MSWRDRLRAALRARFDEAQARALERRYAPAFPASYRQDVDAAQAVDDIVDLEGLDRPPELMQLRLYRPPQQPAHRVHLRIIRRGEALSVSEVLPTFEHFGLRVIAERPYRLEFAGRRRRLDPGFRARALRPAARRGRRASAAELIAAFRAVRAGELDDDGFNRLLIACRAEHAPGDGAARLLPLPAADRHSVQPELHGARARARTPAPPARSACCSSSAWRHGPRAARASAAALLEQTRRAARSRPWSARTRTASCAPSWR